MERVLSRRQKWIRWGLGLLAFYTLTGFVVIPLVARHVATDQITKALKRPAAIEKIRFNPFTLTLGVENFALKQKDTPRDMVSFKRFFLNLRWASLFRLAPLVSHLRLESPVVNISRNDQGIFNFSDLTAPPAESSEPALQEKEAADKSRPPRFSVSNIQISDGRVVFQDDTVNKTHRVENLNLGVPFVSTIGKAAEIFVKPFFSAEIDGRPFSLEGQTLPFHETQETDLRIKLTDLDLPRYMDYVPGLPVVLAAGALSLDLVISFLNTGEKGDLKISGQAALSGLRVTDAGGGPLFNLGRLSLEALAADVFGRTISLGQIKTSGGVLLIDRGADGALNLAALARPAEEAPRRPETAAEPPPAQEPSSPWTISLGALHLDDYQVLADNLSAPGSGEAMVSLGSLAVTELVVDGSPATVKIGDIHWDGPAAALRLEPVAGDQKPVQTDTAPAAAAVSAEPPDDGKAGAAIDINRLALVNARFSFSDHTPTTPFQTELSDINLELTGLSSRPEQTAGLTFSALLDKQSPLTMSGRLNPLAEDLFVDLGLKFDNLELSSFSPYSGQYIGRKIGKGKLFTALGYTVKEQRLNGENHIFIDQLELGERVDSPQATNLPVQLAIFLLQDREKKITLDVPVTGDLNDPAFSLGRTILQVFTNLVVKAGTSPFSLVSGLLGGVDPSHLAFEPGRADIDRALGDIIDRLADLLYNRPALAVELAGFVDPGQDGPALSEQLLRDRIKARKRAELSPEKAAATPLESITIAPEEYAEYLWQVYTQTTFPKQKTALGQDKKLPVQEMEALLRQHVRADESHFKALAGERARQVRDRLLASGKVEPERVFVVETDVFRPEAVEGLGGGRVDVRLKN